MNPRRVVRGGRPVYSRGKTNIRRSFKLPAWNWRLLGIAGVTIVVAAGWWLGFSITSTTIGGNKSVPSTRLVQEVRDELGRHAGWGNLTMVDTDALSARLEAREPLLSSAVVTRQWPHGLHLAVEERKPGIIWTSAEHRYLVDSDGVVVGEANTNQTDLPVVADSSNLPVKVGDRVVSARFITCVDDLVRLIPATKLGIIGLSVPATTTEVFVTTDKSYVVKFDTTRPASESIAALTRVLAQLTATNKAPAEYIDLRIENRAYYK